VSSDVINLDVTPLFNNKNHILWIIANCILFIIVITIIILELVEKKVKNKSHTSTKTVSS
jgi:hypothetical protein